MLISLLLILILPFMTFLILALCPKGLRPAAPFLACLSSATNSILSIWCFISQVRMEENQLFQMTWIKLSQVKSVAIIPGVDAPVLDDLRVGLQASPLNLLMLLIVSIIAFCVHVFSGYYMKEDAAKCRYFAFLNLFTFSMIGIICASSLLQIFMFWELVGLSSYLLVGFWYQKPSASNAARKAFVVNRLADLGFLIGIVLLYLVYGTLDIHELNSIGFLNASLPLGILTIIGILIAIGTFGKSAQWPFSSWLPDAMEGPTPVSALIHSATMVAAGVFLLARVFDLFAASPYTLQFILWTGCFTSLIAALSACTQTDIKKILAYSTISQLGLMMMGIGAGHHNIALFHLFTHACFKSLLFLIAGVLIHRCGTNEIYEINRYGIKKDIQLVFLLFLGVFSLSGIPPFAGFFSKDAILHSVFLDSFFAGVVGLLITLLTAFYSFRMVFVLLCHSENDKHAHADKGIFTTFTWSFPLWTLGILSLVVGFLGSPITHEWLMTFLDPHHHTAEINFTLLAWTLAVIAIGVALAYSMYKKPNQHFDPLPNHVLVKRNFGFDHMYGVIVQRVALPLAKTCAAFEELIPIGVMVKQLCSSILKTGNLMSRFQNGLLQNYLLTTVIVIVISMYFLSQGGH